MNDVAFEYGTTLSGWKISNLKVIEGEVVWARDFLPPQRDGRSVTRWLEGQAVHRIEVTIVQPSGHWSKGPIEWEVKLFGSATPITIITGFGETLFHAKVTLARRVKQFWINTGVERPGYFPSL